MVILVVVSWPCFPVVIVANAQVLQQQSTTVITESPAAAEERAIARQAVIEAYKSKTELERTRMQINERLELEKRKEFKRRGEDGKLKLGRPIKAAASTAKIPLKLKPIAELETDSATYSNVRLLYLMGEEVVFTHSKGGAKLKLGALPLEIRTNVMAIAGIREPVQVESAPPGAAGE